MPHLSPMNWILFMLFIWIFITMCTMFMLFLRPYKTRISLLLIPSQTKQTPHNTPHKLKWPW